MNLLRFCDEVLTFLFSCKSLFIAENQITSIPTEIGELTNLQTLYLGKWSWWLCNDLLGFWLSMTNEFSWFSCDEVLTLLLSYKSLFIDRNDITSIPTEIGELTNLQELRLGKWSWWLCRDWGFLLSLTTEFLLVFVTRCSPCCSCTQKSIFIDYNTITSIPTEIGALTNLHHLFLGKWSWWLCNDLLGFWL